MSTLSALLGLSATSLTNSIRPQTLDTNTQAYIQFAQEANTPGDGHLTQSQAVNQVNQYSLQLRFLQLLTGYLGSSSPSVGGLLNQDMQDIATKRSVGNRLLTYFDDFASANGKTSPNTIEPTDIRTLARRDGNAGDISIRDLLQF